MKRIALSIVALAVLATPALAQQPKPAKPAPAKRIKTITIDPIDVDGDRVTRPLEPISVAETAKSTSLIRIRRDYIDLILKSAETL